MKDDDFLVKLLEILEADLAAQHKVLNAAARNPTRGASWDDFWAIPPFPPPPYPVQPPVTPVTPPSPPRESEINHINRLQAEVTELRRKVAARDAQLERVDSQLQEAKREAQAANAARIADRWKVIAMEGTLRTLNEEIKRLKANASGIPKNMLLSLIKLCHPDHHDNSPLSNSVTGWLLTFRRKS